MATIRHIFLTVARSSVSGIHVRRQVGGGQAMADHDGPSGTVENREPSLQEKQAFQASLKGLSVEHLLHNRDTGVYGKHDRANPVNSHWKVRIVNQELTKMPHQE